MTIDEIKERKRKIYEFLHLLYEKTVNSKDRWKFIPISELSSELGLYPSVDDEDNLTEEEKNKLWETGKEAEQIVSALYEDHFIKLTGRGNPYEGGQVSITKDGIDKVESVLLQEDDELAEIENIASIETQIRYLSRRLKKLREIQAVKGIDTEPHYLIEIEDIEEKLKDLQEQKRDIVNE